MRHYLLLLMFMLGSFPIAAKHVSIQGIIHQATEQELSFSINKNMLSGEDLVYRIRLKEDNSFGIFIDTQDRDWITLRYGDLEIELYAHKAEEQIELSFDATQPIASLRFHGSDATANTFTSNFRRIYQSHSIPPVKYDEGALLTILDGEVAGKARGYEAYDYFNYLDQQFRSQRDYLHRHTNLPASFFRHMEKVLTWRYETNKMAYSLMNRDRLTVDDLRLYWVRYAFLQNTDINDEESLQYPEYQNLLTAFVHYLDLQNPGDEAAKDLAYYRFINGNFSGKAGFFMMAKLLLDNYQRASNPRLAHRNFKRFKQENTYPEFTETLVSVLGENLEYIPREVVPNFKTLGLNGETVYLSDFANKVVYISFWASWCGPCLSGFRQTNHTRRQLLQGDVVLLNVNMDDTEKTWKETLLRHDIPGIQVFAPDWTTLKEQLQFSALPHYILVNKNGMLTYLSTDDLNATINEFYELNLE